jgi:hypothetical protein
MKFFYLVENWSFNVKNGTIENKTWKMFFSLLDKKLEEEFDRRVYDNRDTGFIKWDFFKYDNRIARKYTVALDMFAYVLKKGVLKKEELESLRSLIDGVIKKRKKENERKPDEKQEYVLRKWGVIKSEIEKLC